MRARNLLATVIGMFSARAAVGVGFIWSTIHVESISVNAGTMAYCVL